MSTANRWGGYESRKARAEWRSRLPVDCCRCGLPVVPDPEQHGEGWHVDHYPTAREHGGRETWPAHARCNMRAGTERSSELAAEKRENHRERSAMPPESTRGIRGI